MKKILLFILALTPLFCTAQKHYVAGKISGFEGKSLKISTFYGNENKPVDSVPVLAGGSFRYQVPDKFLNGMYRFRLDKERFIDIIYNFENISFRTTYNELIDSLIFTESAENQVYFDYLKQRNQTSYKKELLDPLLSLYPTDDPFYEQISAKSEALEASFEQFVAKLIELNSKLFVSRIVKMDHTPKIPAKLADQPKSEFMKVHFFDNMDFGDTAMLRTNIISGKLLQYLSLYQNNRMSKEQLEIEFIKAVQVIMTKMKEYPEVYQYSMNYLIGGFESYGFEKVITYIADNINLEETCVDDERKALLEKKVESLKKYAVGKQIPDFSVTSITGEKLTLSSAGSEYLLVVFWATWCPHCSSLLPELTKIYFPESKGKLQMVAISLDDQQSELETFLGKGNYQFFVACDYKKWKGELVQLLDIYATPTMFLLYKDRTILAKPTTYGELKNELFQRNILH
jgi:peroxiredoxin